VAGATDQDAAIAGEAVEAGRGLVVAVNKWDLVADPTPEKARAIDDEIRRRLPFLDFAPILHISALTGAKTPRLLELIDRVAVERRRRVPTPELNRFIAAATAAQLPVAEGRRPVRILFAAQTGVAPPTFVLFTNIAASLHFSYVRYLTNRLRDEYGFEGSPIRLHVRRRARARKEANAR
jgi:GTP-binding protein